MIGSSEFLLAFDISGSLGGVAFTPDDVLEFNSGAWSAFFQGGEHGWPEGAVIKGVLGVVEVPRSEPRVGPGGVRELEGRPPPPGAGALRGSARAPGHGACR